MQTIKTFIKDHPHMWWGLYLPVYPLLRVLCHSL